MRIGRNVYIGFGTWLNAKGGLTLEDEVLIAPYVVISTLQHTMKDGSYRFGPSIEAPVVVKRGTWLAAHCSVKCGVVVGEANLIAANSFVSNSTDGFMVMGGVPARPIKDART